MAYYNICPDCGSNLDPGEKCTCSAEKTKQQDFFSRHLKKTASGQLAIVFDDRTVTVSGRRERH